VFPNLNPMELMVLLGVAVLLFGKRLPEVGRSLGRGIVEFKKGIRGVEDELRSATDIVHNRAMPSPSYQPAESTEPTVPKFESPQSSPVPTMEYEPQPYQD
jgi:sec-independent protein translocase protein TatA